jgi:cell division protein FtsL
MATIAVTNVRRTYGITPEIYFHKPIDNSRLLRVVDPKKKRDMAVLVGVLGVLLALFLVFCWQHYRAIEFGYRNETLRQEREQLLQARRHLQLEEAQLREPGRIDELAQQLGLQAPTAGQIVRLEGGAPHSGVPMMARATAVSVISATR